MEQNPVVFEAKGLSKSFGSKAALKNINLTLYRGKIIGLLGPNGSGKTTLIKLTAGLIQPDAGEIRINGKPIGTESKLSVAYLPDKSYLNDWMKVRELVEMFSEFYSNFSAERAHKLIADLGINEEMRLKALSKGNQEKIQLILVMSRKADLYLLDEPIGDVAAIAVVDESEDVIFISSDGIIIRIPVSQISTFARPSKGVRVMRVSEGEQLVTVACTPSEEDQENPEETAAEEVSPAEDSENSETEE